MTVAVIEYGSGNIGSIYNMLRKVGARVELISSPGKLENVEKVILPGVGAFDSAMTKLETGGWIPALRKNILIGKKPLLAICVGMQLLTKKSEEGKKNGLGFIDAETIKFSFDRLERNLNIPHMGWNMIHVKKKNLLMEREKSDKRFYFAHSFHVVCRNKDDISSTANYGYNFVSSIQKDNIMGVQFHPEKSHRFGKDLMNRFAEL